MNKELYRRMKAHEREKSFTYPNVCQADIARAEEQLGLALPLDYCDFLLEFGQGGLDGMEILGFGLHKEAYFVEETKARRLYGMDAKLIAIEDCGEWVYCIRAEDGSVVKWYQDSPQLYPVYNSFDEFLADRVKDSLENMD